MADIMSRKIPWPSMANMNVEQMVEEVVRSQMLEDAKTSDNPASSKVIEAYDTFQRPWSEEGGPD